MLSFLELVEYRGNNRGEKKEAEYTNYVYGESCYGKA